MDWFVFFKYGKVKNLKHEMAMKVHFPLEKYNVQISPRLSLKCDFMMKVLCSRFAVRE